MSAISRYSWKHSNDSAWFYVTELKTEGFISSVFYNFVCKCYELSVGVPS